MRIERLEIAGFKSFADPVAITFPTGATAIVGPNGCGKSNIADALTWVLGELGAAAIRARGKDLIFGGSEGRAPLGVAEVRVEFSGVPTANGNGAAQSDAPGRRVVVARRMDATGISIYEMDGRRSTRRAILRTFAGTGLGSGSYAVIGQGRVTEVLTSKPEDLRLMVEEAAGLGAYRLNRKEAESNLRAAGGSLKQVRARLRELDRHIRQARRDARRAGQARKLERRAAELALERSLAKRDALTAVVRRGGAPLAALEAESRRRGESLEVFERFLGARRDELDAARARFGARSRAALDCRSRRDRAEAVIGEGRRAERNRAAETVRLDAEEADLRERLATRRAEARESARRARALPARIETLAAALAGRTRDRDEARAEERRRHLGLEAIRGERARIEASLRTLGMACAQHGAAGDRLQSDRVRLDGDRRALEAESDHAARAATAASDRRRLAGRESLRLREEGRAADQALDQASAALERARAAEAEAGRRLADVAARRAAQRALVVSRRQLGPAAARRLAAAAGEGPLLGAVGEAVEVDPGYESAAERLVGVHRLRVGRASDLLDLAAEPGAAQGPPLEVLVSELASACPEPGGSGGTPAPEERLRDHVTAGDPAVRRSLPDAEVTEDLASALRRFLERPGVYVTRAGESVAPPGVVAIGRGGPGAGFLAARAELRELDRAEAAAREQAGRLATDREKREAERADARRLRAGCREARAAADAARSRAERDAERAAATATDVRRRLRELTAGLTRNREDRERNDAAAERAEATLARDRERLAGTATELTAAETALAAARGRLRGAEREFLAADRELAREQAIAEEARRAETVRERETRADEARLEAIATARDRLEAEEREWAVRRRAEDEEMAAAAAGAREEQAAADRLAGRATDLAARVAAGEAALGPRREELQEVERRLADLRSEVARAETLVGHLEDEFRRERGRSLAAAAASMPAVSGRRSVEDIEPEIETVRAALDDLLPVNQVAESRLAALEAERAGPAAELADVESGIRDGLRALERQEREAQRTFRDSLDRVGRTFDEAFRQLFGGGRAELRLVARPAGPSADGSKNGADRRRADDPGDAAGIGIFAEPPGKRFQSVRLLSGGEKALTAIAFLIALFRYRPAPLCLLDEVDAPLDDDNSHRFAALLDELREVSQLIVITHNRVTMEACQHLYGVTMEEPGVSRVLSLTFDDGLDRLLASAPEPSALPA